MDLDGVEAQPRGSREPRLMDARHTIEQYLAGKPYVRVYSWPERVRERTWVPNRDDEDWDDDDCDN